MTSELRTEEKAAALMVAVGPKLASGVLQFLSEDEVELLATEVARIGKVRSETIEAVMAEVYEQAAAQRLLASGGLDYARELLTEWHESRGIEIIERLMADINLTPFHFVREIEAEQLVNLLKEEHPQTVALILAHQPAAYAASVLRGFDPEMQNEVALRVATMGRTSPEVVQRVESALRGRLGKVSSADVAVRGGIRDLAELLNNSDRSMEKSILGSLSEFDSGLAEQVRALMFVFEDIATLDDRSIQAILKDVDNKTLAMAMKGVSPDVRDAILRNMSQRASETLIEEIDLLGPVRRTEVEAAQSEVVTIIRRLDESGEIVISRGAESDLIE